MGIKDKLRDKPVLGFALAVQDRYGSDRAGYLAATITYYAFLSVFPLLLLGFSVIGFVLAGDPQAQEDLVETLSESVPGLQSVLGENIQAIVDARAATGIIGLLGLLWSGLGATEAAGFAVSRVFRVQPYGSFLKKKAWSLSTTVGLGLLALVALGVVAVVGNFSPGGILGAALLGLGPVVGAALDFGLFLIAYRILTQRQGPPFPKLWKGALFAAIGWTVLKIVGTWYVARTVSNSSAVYGTFAGAVGILLLLYLASRLLLYGAEINAVAMEREGHDFEPMLDDREGGGFVTERPKGWDQHPSNQDGKRSMPDLVKSIAGDTATLVRKEVELARQEVVEGIMAKVKGAGAFGVAGFIALLALIFFGITTGTALKIVLEPWAAWLVTAGIFLVLAGMAAAFGIARMKGSSVKPERTRKNVKEDVEWARAQLRR